MTLFPCCGSLLRVCALVALCGLSGLAAAQENDQTQSATEPPSSESKPAATPPTTAKDTFKPSEEVSEDLSVSFPVDI